jgi:hypothetical protein
LVLSLFFPRIVLLYYYMKTWIPANTIPFWGDAAMAVFIPRVLILLYIYENIGVGGWFWIHVVMMILTWDGGSSSASSSRRR